MLRRAGIAIALISLPAAGAHAVAADAALKAQDAAAALVRGDAGTAVTGYTDALKDTALTNDRRATILNDRAVAYARLGQTKLAIDDFNRAAQLFPEYAAIYNNRGNLLLALGYPEEAIKDFNRAIVLAPGYAAALSNRAGAYAKVGAQRPGHPRLHARHPPDAAVGRAACRTRARASPPPDAPTPRSAISRARSTPIRALPPPIAAAPRPSSTSAAMQDAIEDLSRAIAFDVNNAELYLLRGQRLSRVRQCRSGDEGLHARRSSSTRARPAPSRRAASPTASRKPTRRRSPTSIAPSSLTRARRSPSPIAPSSTK